MANNVLRGKELMLFIDKGTGSTHSYNTIAYATNHTLSISSDSLDISSKDGGSWSSVITSKIQWEMTCEALYAASGESSLSIVYDELFQNMVNNKPINIAFGEISNGIGENGLAQSIPSGGWTPSGTLYSGEAYITSLEINASDGDAASMSITLSGNGAITKITQ